MISGLVEFLLDWMVELIHEHPDAPFSRFMMKRRSARTDVPGMTRMERLKSALVFLFWGFLFAALWAGFGYIVFGLKLINPENPITMVVTISLVFAAGIGIVGGLYLLIRVIA
jgi:hypothetical protein